MKQLIKHGLSMHRAIIIPRLEPLFSFDILCPDPSQQSTNPLRPTTPCPCMNPTHRFSWKPNPTYLSAASRTHTNIISDHTQLREKYPGYEYALRGFDMPFYDPDKPGGDVGRYPIFSMQEGKDSDGKPKLPANVEGKLTRTCSQEVNAKVWRSLATMITDNREASGESSSTGFEWKNKISADVKVAKVSTEVNMVSFKKEDSEERSNTHKIESTIEKEGEVIWIRAHCEGFVTEISLNKIYSPRFEERFVRYLVDLSNNLGTRKSAVKEYKKFIDMFGTHFIKRAVFGASKEFMFMLDKEYTKQLSDTQAKECSRNMVSGGALNVQHTQTKHKCTMQNDRNEKQDFKSSVRKMNRTRGILPAHNQMFEPNTPMVPIRRDIEVMAKLFDPEPFKRLKDQAKELGLDISTSRSELMMFFTTMYTEICDLFKVILGTAVIL